MTPAQEKSFIESIAGLAQKACGHFGYLPSVLIAQCCLETGYGQGAGCAPLVRHHNVLGMKTELLPYDSDWWDGHSDFEKTTPEWEGGKRITKPDRFRAYPDVYHCLMDYLQFMRDAKYDNGTWKYRDCLGYTDQYTLISTVAGRGYCTDPAYATSVMGIIREHDLTGYDTVKTIVVPRPTTVREYLGRFGKTLIDRIAINRNKGQRHDYNSHKYLAVHFLGVNGENPDLYDGCYGGHFYVSKAGQCYQAADVGDRLWHVGASSGFRYIHPDARNDNTIGIEVATYTTSGRNNDNETWYYTRASQEALVQLVAGIMLVYGIPMSRLLRHGDITTKNCPSPYKRDQGKGDNWTWDAFRSKVAQHLDQAGSATGTAGTAVMPAPTVLRYGHTGAAVSALQGRLIALGYDCGSSGADGIYGYDTANAVRRFQGDRGLTVDGLAGPITLAALENAVDAQKGAQEATQATQETTQGKERFFVQVGAYGSKANAAAMVQRAQAAGFEAVIEDYGVKAKKGTRWHVQCGAFVLESKARELAARLEGAGFETTMADA